jgi:hypothetical protein
VAPDVDVVDVVVADVLEDAGGVLADDGLGRDLPVVLPGDRLGLREELVGVFVCGLEPVLPGVRAAEPAGAEVARPEVDGVETVTSAPGKSSSAARRAAFDCSE